MVSDNIWTYSKAGIDLSRHRSMHRYALENIAKLSKELKIKLMNIGSYTTFIDLDGIDIAIHVDGVGTKTIVLEKMNRYEVIGWDCVAMNVNDVVCDGAKPVVLVDYIAMPNDDEEVFRRVFNGIIDAAKTSRVAVIGGETAILPDLVSGIDAVCIVFAVKKNSFVNKARKGDVVIGVSSWGLHANGYTLVRKVIENSIKSYNVEINGINIGEEFSRPTAIYSNMVMETISQGLISSVAHITGGTFRKVKRVLGEDLDIHMKMPEPPKIFIILMNLGKIPVSEMYSVFNMGIGLVLTAPRDKVRYLYNLIEKYGFNAYKLGEVIDGSGAIHIDTPFGEKIEL